MSKYLYNMIEINNDWNGIPKHYDCLLLAGGSDYRAYEILRKAKVKNVLFDTVYLFDFDERHIEDETLKRSYNEYETLDFNIKKIPCSILNPSLCIKSFNGIGIDFSKTAKIAIDISCFTKPYFFLILKHLQSLRKFDSVSVFYSEPKSYIFTKGLYTSYHSSNGPLTILEIPGYSGYDRRGQKRLLIILLGFDGNLSKEINEDIAPIKTIIVNGFPGYAPKYKDISLISNERLIQDHSDIKYSRANNPFETYNLLESIRREEKLKGSDGDLFINIAPLGTKPMALGACLYAIYNPDVRIVYPMPENYEKVTTEKCWSSWLYDIPLM